MAHFHVSNNLDMALSGGGRNYVSQMVREIGISRPLLHLHLKKLEDAGLIVSEMALDGDGKARNYFSVAPFEIALTPDAIAAAAKSLTTNPEN